MPGLDPSGQSFAPPPIPASSQGMGPMGGGGPPPPEPLSELEQLHAAGDRKFGRGNAKLPGGRNPLRGVNSRAGGGAPTKGVSFQQ